MEQQRIHFNYKKSENINNTVRYTSVEGKNTIEIQIKKEQCSDGMSEKKYNYSVKVKLNENNYSGCAVKYGEMPE
jgi:putative lipoprotein